MALAVTAALTATGVLPAYASPAPSVPSSSVKSPDWKPCKDEPEVDCAKISVPVDWSKPNGEKIKIALARRPATDPGRRIGSLVYNPGGPGASGVDMLKGSGAEAFSKKIRSQFDIVGFDPRGVGSSAAVKCPVPGVRGTVLTEDLIDAVFTGKSLNEQQLRLIKKANQQDGRACRQESGKVLEFLDNQSVVRDIDAIRAALGDEKLTFYGVSYGTLMGQQYAQLFPDRVRALLLDSNMDHSLPLRAFLVSEAKAAQDSFDEYVKWCDTSTECAVHQQGARKTFAQLRTRAAQGKLVDPDSEEKVGSSTLLDSTQSYLLSPSWEQLSTWHAKLAESKASAAKAAAPGASEQSVEKTADGIFCADWNVQLPNAAALRGHLKASAAVAPDMRVSGQAIGAVLSCQNWPTPVRNPQAPMIWNNVPPVLMVNSRFDPSTPYEWAQNAARQSGATLLTYEGWGHGVVGSKAAGSCVANAVTGYLVDLKTPAAGATCPAPKL
ncbi:alpha/beta hydrolase [Kineosporia babensis]